MHLQGSYFRVLVSESSGLPPKINWSRSQSNRRSKFVADCLDRTVEDWLRARADQSWAELGFEKDFP